MNGLRVLVVGLVFSSFFVAGGSLGHAQCFLPVLKNCRNEQYSNPCSEACTTVGAYCGLHLSGDPTLQYLSVISAEFGEDDIEYASSPIYCGQILRCQCTFAGQFGPTCNKISAYYGNFTVSEIFPDGEDCLSEDVNL